MCRLFDSPTDVPFYRIGGGVVERAIDQLDAVAGARENFDPGRAREQSLDVAIVHNGQLVKLQPINEVAELSDGEAMPETDKLLVSRAKEELTESAHARLQALVDTTDGFELAEVDLELRGEGQLLGTRQSGLSDLRFTKLRADRPLLERARAAAQELIDVEGPLDDALAALFPDEGLAA